MGNTEYGNYVRDTFNWARLKGICKTKGEFAELVGVHRATLSAVENGKSSGKSTVKRIEKWMNEHRTDIPTAQIIGKLRFDDTYWETFRAEVSGRILAGLVHGHNSCYSISDKDRKLAVYDALSLTDELIEQLKGHE